MDSKIHKNLHFVIHLQMSKKQILPYRKNKNSKKIQVRQMFDSISARYDIINRIISGGLDLKWRKNVVKLVKRKSPKRILDVGSGAGHFVEACRRDGIHADGIELSESSREFAREIWGFELDGRNFFDVVQDYKGYDLVTFWGLLEHTPFPGKILDTAYEIVSESSKGMVISKIPRWNSLSSAAQRLNSNTIIRHIDPMGHIMLFTDASAAELYLRSKFKPTAAWYYGMDIYETFMQLGNQTGLYKVLTETGDFQMNLQQFIDEEKFSDGLTLVGIPNK